MVALTDSNNSSGDISATVTWSASVVCEPISFASCLMAWGDWFETKEEAADFQNQLRIEGYRKDLHTSSIVLPQRKTRKEFRNYDRRLKVDRTWNGKEITF